MAEDKSLTPVAVRKPNLLQVGSAPAVSMAAEATRKKVINSTLAAAAEEPLILLSPAVILVVFAAAVASRTMTE